MAAINFPASPSPGDKYPITGSIGGKVWSWDGTSWNIVSTNGSVTIIDDTARSFSFTVTYTNVAGNYNVVGTDRNGEVNGLNPTITVNEEDTLIFNVNAAGHPFYVVWAHGGSSDQVGGGQGVNTASNQGTVNGTVTWVTDVGDGVSLPQGGLFYYQCGNHPSMYGTIKVLLKKTSDSATHIHDLIDLNDTPNAYDNGKYLKSTATGTEWSTVTGGGGTTYDVVDDQDDGLAPQLPSVSPTTKYLRGDGSWQVPPDTDTDTNTTYNVVSTGADGLAPQLPSSHGGKFLKADGSWEVPSYSTIPNTFTTAAAGLVPITPGGTSKFLRADGNWAEPTSGGSAVADGNDYIISASLGTGGTAKVLTLGFTDTTKNRTVDLASINTDTDTTYNVVDATADGLAPQLPASHGGKYLRADGSWEVPPDTDTDTDTTYNVVSTTADGLAPQLPGSSTGKYLKDDGTWEVPPDTDTDTDTTYEIKALANNNDFNIQIDASGSGTDSSVRFEEGNNITLDVINSGHIKISATDNNTTYSNFNTSNAGLVPVSPGGTTKYLRADGTWQEVSGGGSADGNDYVTNLSLSGTTLTASFATTSLNQTVDLASINTDTDTTYNVVSISADGLAPTLPASGGSTQYLRGDGTWQTPPDTDTTYSNFNTSDAGLVPVSPGGTTKYLRADGTWQTVTSGGSDGNDYVTNLSLSGTTLTASFSNTSLNQTVNLASINTDTNTTYNVVSTSADGLAPQLPSSHGGKYLRADGSWQVPPDTDTDTNTNYYANDFTYDNSTKVLSIGYAGNTSLDTTVTINPSGGGDIPSGTAMLFFQGSAPTGWSATGSYNDHAIRVVGSGGGGTGGSVGFTSAFSNHTVSISDSDTVSVGGSVTISGNCGGTQVMYVTTTQAWLTTDQIPSHNHQYHNPIGTSGGQHGFMDTTNSGSSGQPNTLSTGGSNYHTHAIIMYYISGSNFSFEGTDSWSDSDTVSISGSDDVDLRVKYVNAIVCTKD